MPFARDSRTVLLVDDNASVLETAASFLRSRALSVITSDSPFGVSSLVREHRPHVLVLDVMMPALDGGTIARLLTASAERVPAIIFYSAAPEEALYKLSREHRGSTYVMKTEGLVALHRAVLQALPA